MSVTIKLRRDKASDWILANPVLSDGEPGYENDTGKFKIGNGVARWLDLNYFTSSETGTTSLEAALAALQNHINSLTPHPVYDDGLDGPSFLLLYKNAKV